MKRLSLLIATSLMGSMTLVAYVQAAPTPQPAATTDVASRVAALDLGFLPAEGGRDVAGIMDGAQKGEIDFIYLLGADEFDLAHLGRAFIVYQGSHGDLGAHHADVILPGSAYTEKDGTYVNFEGRVQQAERAAFSPGEAKEDWTILRALSDVLGVRLPYDNRAQLLKALVADKSHFADLSVAPVHADTAAATWEGIGMPGPLETTKPVGHAITDYYLTNPIARASETMAKCSREFAPGTKMAAE